MNRRNTDKFCYSVVLPEDLSNHMEKIAEERKTTVVEILGKFILLGLLAVEVEKTPGAALLLQEGFRKRPLLLLL